MVDIILPVSGEHKCKTTVQLVRITTHEYPQADIHYINIAILRAPDTCRKAAEIVAFQSNADASCYSVTRCSTKHS